MSVGCEKVFIPGEVPLLELDVVNLEELGDALGRTALLGDGDSELVVGHAVVEGLGAIDRSVDLEAEIEVLAGEEVGLVRWQNATKGRARSEALEGLGRGESQESRRSSNGGEATHGKIV